MFFSPFSIAITSLGEERANLSVFRTFVRFVLVWICRFPIPLGVWEGLRFVNVALPGLFSYLFLPMYGFICAYLYFFSLLLPIPWEDYTLRFLHFTRSFDKTVNYAKFCNNSSSYLPTSAVFINMLRIFGSICVNTSIVLYCIYVKILYV